MTAKILCKAAMAAFLFLLCSCNKPYREQYPELRVNATEYELSKDGGSFQLMVYYSGAWTVSLRAEDTGWVLLSRDGASGQAYLRVTYDSAVAYARSAWLDLQADNGDQLTITLNQKAL